MENFTLAELGVFLGVLGGIITSLLLTIQKSKCSRIGCCGAECIRDPKFKTDEQSGNPAIIPPNPDLENPQA